MNYYRGPAASRDSFFRGAALSSAVKLLIAWNVIFFLLQYLFRGRMELSLGLLTEAVWRGEVWRLVTYMFLHGDLTHILFNMLALWMFGSDLENLWGTKRFTIYYFFTGIGAAITTVLLSNSLTIGASGAIYGLLLAFGMTYPNRQVTTFLPALFILLAVSRLPAIVSPGLGLLLNTVVAPLLLVVLLFAVFQNLPVARFLVWTIPAKLFVAIYGAMELFATVFDRGSGIAHVAHLGGLVFGFFFLKGLPGKGAWTDWQRKRRRAKFKVLEFRGPSSDDRFDDRNRGDRL